MNKHKNKLPLYILGLVSVAFMVLLDVVLVTVVGFVSTLGVEDPLQMCAEVIKLIKGLMSTSLTSAKIPVWSLLLVAVLFILAIAAYFIGGYFKRNQDLLKIKTYDKNKNKQTLEGLTGAKRPSLSNFWVGAAKVYGRSLVVTLISATALIVFVVMAFLAVVPLVTIISKSNSISSGFPLVLSAILALVSAWVILFVFVLIKVYMIGLYRGMVMYADKFIRKSVNSVNSAFVRKYTDYLMYTFLYFGVRAVLLWVCATYSVQIAKANVMVEIYILDAIFKIGYLILVNRKCIGE
ncbi:MAG: hypothetical protein IKV30_07735 [Clostridia bacterium]|nr:hypothetical protein [Clostridia bacterium]